MSQRKHDQAASPNASYRRKSPPPQYWQTLIGCLGVCAVIVLLLMTADLSLPWFSRIISNRDEDAIAAQNTRYGTVSVETAGAECEIMKFDNNTGRSVDGSGSCHSTVAVDSHGKPVPMGTVHRLDSIRKSFAGEDH